MKIGNSHQKDRLKPPTMLACTECWCLGAGIPGPRTKDYTKHSEPRPAPAGNPVYRVKSYPNTTAPEPEGVEPLNGKQRGVLDLEPGGAALVRSCSTQHLCIMSCPPEKVSVAEPENRSATSRVAAGMLGMESWRHAPS